MRGVCLQLAQRTLHVCLYSHNEERRDKLKMSYTEWRGSAPSRIILSVNHRPTEDDSDTDSDSDSDSVQSEPAYDARAALRTLLGLSN